MASLTFKAKRRHAESAGSGPTPAAWECHRTSTAAGGY
jgi:hypothetical protein